MAISELDSSLVTVGNPVDGGSCFTSFKSDVTLPTDATTKMSTLTGFESLGELSDNGFTESKSVSTDAKKGWHGTTLLVVTTDEDKKYKAEFVEVNRPSVAKLRYGADNVTEGTDGSVSKIEDKFGVDTIVPLVFDELESNGFLRRTVVKKARVTSFDDIGHKRGDLIVYGMEFTVLDPGDGSPAVTIYRAKPAASSGAGAGH